MQTHNLSSEEIKRALELGVRPSEWSDFIRAQASRNGSEVMASRVRAESKARQARIVQMHHEGMSLAMILRVTGLSDTTVRKYLLDAGVTLIDRRPPSAATVPRALLSWPAPRTSHDVREAIAELRAERGPGSYRSGPVAA